MKKNRRPDRENNDEMMKVTGGNTLSKNRKKTQRNFRQQERGET